MLFRFYNLREGRPNEVVAQEVLALLTSKPLVLGLCEGVGYTMPHVKGYHQIHVRKDQSHANLIIYIRDDVYRNDPVFHVMTHTWLNQNNDKQHSPRVFATFKIRFKSKMINVVIAHMPPKQPHRPDKEAQAAAWAENQNAIVEVLKNSTKPFVAMADWNGKPWIIAQEVGAHVAGTDIDAALVKGLVVKRWKYITRVLRKFWVKLRSDHKHALTLTLNSVS